MKKTASVITFAILALAATIYPTYLWGEELLEQIIAMPEKERRIVIDGNPGASYVRIEQRAWLFGEKTMPKQLGNRTYNLQRRLYKLHLFFVDYPIALFIANLVWIFFGKIEKKKAAEAFTTGGTVGNG